MRFSEIAHNALRDIAQANLEREQRIVHIAQRRYSAGLGTRLEVNESLTRCPTRWHRSKLHY